ncbi:MAG: hypothetical protein E2O75_06470 [Chloroflexi bacterium]|nr:MAG: hypothetical protein E2O75_06470 [Chloroflexota bacterium]
MTPANDARQFAERAHENRLQISVDDAAAIDDFNAAAEAAFPTVREIDAPGFEQAAILIPTPSGCYLGPLQTPVKIRPGKVSSRKNLPERT